MAGQLRLLRRQNVSAKKKRFGNKKRSAAGKKPKRGSASRRSLSAISNKLCAT